MTPHARGHLVSVQELIESLESVSAPPGPPQVWGCEGPRDCLLFAANAARPIYQAAEIWLDHAGVFAERYVGETWETRGDNRYL